MQDPFALILAAATLGQTGLAVALLVSRIRTHQVYLPLAALFLALAVIAGQPLVGLWTRDVALRRMMLLPAYLSLGPLFWWYVVGLTSETRWHPSRRDLGHLVVPALGVLLCLAGLWLPGDVRHELLIDGNDRSLFVGDSRDRLTFAGYLMIATFTLLLIWLLQIGYYAVRLCARLLRYRRRLRDLFASNEQRELGWILGLLGIIGGSALLMISAFVLDNFVGVTLMGSGTRGVLLLALVAVLAVWGLRQKPGFDGRYLDAGKQAPASKYERSALDGTHSARIADKINAAMGTEHLYLQPGLSLADLAEHVGISANYVSQTLNETLQESFFDYVNRHRIEAATPMILENRNTITDVAYAVGFNARSSFYTAFKRVTGQTPVAYRKSAGGADR